MTRDRWLLAGLILLGLILRLPGLGRGTDRAHPHFLWRENDISSIARNYQREGMNILYPRIDWRGTGPGYTESEFPLYPWTIAVVQRVTGESALVGRVISLVLSMATLIVFAALARGLLPPVAAAAAVGVMAVNPLFVGLSTAIVAEPLMLAGYVGGIYAFWRWLENDSGGALAAATVLLALAVLAKAPAAHVGLLLLALLLWKRGWNSLKDPRPWVVAILVLLPGALWYRHAHNLWLEYGNSLGMSNETHWAGLAVLWHPRLVFNVMRQDLTHVWAHGALALGLFGLVTHRRQRGATFALLWLGAVFVYLLAVARTTGDDWAYYYHIVALPPAAMLIGLGVAGVLRLHPGRRVLSVIAAGALVFTTAAVVAWRGGGGHGARDLAFGGALSLIVALLWWWYEVRSIGRRHDAGERSPGVAAMRGAGSWAVVLVALTGWAGLDTAVGLRRIIRPAGRPGLYACARLFAPKIPPGALVLASGGPCVDDDGAAAAYNASYMFYWTDRKGFNTCVQDQTITQVAAFADSGAQFFIAQKARLEETPGFTEALLARYPVVSECPEAYLLDLRPREPGTDPAAGSQPGPGPAPRATP